MGHDLRIGSRISNHDLRDCHNQIHHNPFPLILNTNYSRNQGLATVNNLHIFGAIQWGWSNHIRGMWPYTSHMPNYYQLLVGYYIPLHFLSIIDNHSFFTMVNRTPCAHHDLHGMPWPQVFTATHLRQLCSRAMVGTTVARLLPTLAAWWGIVIYF